MKPSIIRSVKKELGCVRHPRTIPTRMAAAWLLICTHTCNFLDVCSSTNSRISFTTLRRRDYYRFPVRRVSRSSVLSIRGQPGVSFLSCLRFPPFFISRRSVSFRLESSLLLPVSFRFIVPRFHFLSQFFPPCNSFLGPFYNMSEMIWRFEAAYDINLLPYNIVQHYNIEEFKNSFDPMTNLFNRYRVIRG